MTYFFTDTETKRDCAKSKAEKHRWNCNSSNYRFRKIFIRKRITFQL